MSEVFAAAGDYPRALDSLAQSISFNSEKGSGQGLEFNLASLRQIESQLPGTLRERARELERRAAHALGFG